ncbi:MAG: polyphosphate kinase 2 [Caulobacteraceae bacterium]|nr:MAG: polyphosphate kinase 2 [Caulobacteraceae bacterium]
MGKKSDFYEDALEQLQVELVDSQAWLIEQGMKVLIVFEGRDSAGKDGAIKRMTEYMSARQTRVVALPKPTELEQTQWYFQRYTAHLPAAGEVVILNRSWYNRGGVEPVMGFCTPEQQTQFLKDAPRYERMLVDSGVIIIKFWLDITKDEQARRLEDRKSEPLKRFKNSSLDSEAQTRWDAYSQARDRMLDETHSGHAPWTVVATDDKKTARLNIMRHVLHRLGYPELKCEKPDKDVVFSADKDKGRLAS